MDSLDRDTLFVALTRPQLLFGVPYGFVIGNAVATTELFLLFKSVWVLAAAIVIHAGGAIVSLREPRFFDIWLVRLQRCPRVPNHRRWRCNAYRP
ncbi:type IV secretion system protein VirB3 [Sphingomonas sp. Leaf4]|uniref:type IV secretion system protein VirB3 n=1 Tax=Sphingomonas sp. Leaf4 TaxID=2876553 RepID=UPI001E54D9FF|nr:type IV secretion system protein VirB3 [Sphingomonas sp. Leaf4]